MKKDNWQLFDVWATQHNKMDYAEFTRICEARKIVPLSALEFASKVGVILCSQVAYPELDAKEAYMLFINKNPLAIPSAAAEQKASEQQTGCNGCGGGTVR